NTLPTNSHWEALARESLRDDLDWQQRSLTIAILASKTADETLMEALQRWQGEQALMFGRWQGMLAELQSADVVEFAMLTVALRELLDLAEVSRIQYGDRTDNESARV
ncbi:NAD-glutamate dehydrogenase, partial [Wenyingzhuangia sp. 1_MG-2023]|nr:NAD-glutamate dehydrogenase [Wenyingzhuangia sp. 1_MG-2023]